ncbi:MAG: sigma-54 dependent transcriptional regulator [Planctomycetes bacterium]|nr:sigma-54 dependent transcriptional regulator [Planctomycetota bacterium]
MSNEKLLVVDDDALIRRSLAEMLRGLDYRVFEAGTGAEALRVFGQVAPDLVITDFNMPEVDGLQLLKELKARKADLPVILVTGYGTVEQAVDAMKAGAYDYVSKPILDDEMKLAIKRALDERSLRAENTDLKKRLDMRYGFDAIVGRDYKMQRIYDTIDSVAGTKATVLVTGESGTGKTLIARALHHNSPRKAQPFVEVNCGALPETLLESELFGYKRGAFTGANADRLGKFAAADKGTIFLDEINNASPMLQMKLLRILQDREFEPLGSNETMQVDVRVVIATNLDLPKEVEKGTFRRDLYYRINVVAVHMPPIRERVSDIPLLAEHFLARFAKENGKKIDGIDEAALDVLVRYPWPGNVRELENCLERAVVLTRNVRLTVEDLPPLMREGAEETPVQTSDDVVALKVALEDPERRYIELALRRFGSNRQETAKALDINRTTLFNKMRKYGLLEKY